MSWTLARARLSGSLNPQGSRKLQLFPFTSRELFLAQQANETPDDPGKGIIIQNQLLDAHVCLQTHSLSSWLRLIQLERIPRSVSSLFFTWPGEWPTTLPSPKVLGIPEGNSRPCVGNYRLKSVYIYKRERHRILLKNLMTSKVI